MDQIKIEISNQHDGMTIKEFLKSFNIGRSQIETIRNSKMVELNNQLVNLDVVIKKGDQLSFGIKEKIDFEPWFINLDIVYEDDYILIVNKPSKMLIHPDESTNQKTLVNAVSGYYYEHKIFRNVRYAHRIDFDTSGIVIFAKDFLTLGKLNKLIETHQLKRYYLALCENKFKNKEGTINLAIGRDRHHNNKFRVGDSSQSKEAITHYEVVKEYGKYSLVKLLLEMGRTHQIRVHMSYINHPLLGDELYGGKTNLINRVSLHSYEVKFIHPITNQFVDVICSLPIDMEGLMVKRND